jgi:predicted metal-dependent enzyme (double-stranded beta helix superfamily)
LIDVARGLGEVEWWRRATERPATGRSTRLIAVTDSYEAWLIHWAPGGDIALHDHGGSSGAMWVLTGELEESYTDAVVRRPLRRRFLGAGAGLTFGPGHVHDIVNPTSSLATTIHVYSPHLASMTFYDDAILPLHTDTLVLGQHVG